MKSFDDRSGEENNDERQEQDDVNYARVLASVENMEEIHGDARLFVAFFVMVIPDMVGRLRYKRFWSGSRERRYEELVSVADEGFGLLILQNNMEKWKAEVEACYRSNVHIPDSNFTPHAKKRDRDPSTVVPARKDGWSREGLKRYNELCVYIQRIRRDREKMNDFNRCVKEMIKRQKSRKSRGKNSRQGDSIEEDEEDEYDDEFVVFSGDIDLTGGD